MRLLLVILLFASCTTTKKALNKISEGVTKPAERKQLATICAAEFPVLEFISEGTTVTDSTEFNNHVAGLERSLFDAQSDLLTLIDQVEQKEVSIDVLKSTYSKRIDSLSYVVNHMKNKPPVVKYITRDTSHLINRAELERCEITNTQLRKEIAGKDVKIEALEAENKILSERPDRYWRGFLHGFIAGVVILFIIGVFMKLKRII